MTPLPRIQWRFQGFAAENPQFSNFKKLREKKRILKICILHTMVVNEITVYKSVSPINFRQKSYQLRIERSFTK